MPMPLVYSYLFPAMWIAYFAYWWRMAPAAEAKSAERHEAAASRIVRLVLFICAAVLLGLGRTGIPVLDQRFLPVGPWCFWVGAAVTASGLLFSVWARAYLGTNWSQAVTIKQDHELITGGPYALVRHPIYSGLLAAFLGCAIARGEWRGLIAVALILAALWPKLRLEEKWMHSHFGDSYDVYSRRVARIIPHIL